MILLRKSPKFSTFIYYELKSSGKTKIIFLLFIRQGVRDRGRELGRNGVVFLFKFGHRGGDGTEEEVAGRVGKRDRGVGKNAHSRYFQLVLNEKAIGR